MLINEVSLALNASLAPGYLIEVVSYVPGTNERLVLVNNAVIYAGIHYEEPDSTHLRILFQASPGDILTTGLLTGYSYGPAGGWTPIPAPLLKYARDYPGTITLGLPVVTTDSRVTHLRVFRNRGGVITMVDSVANGTTNHTITDARIGDEYFLRTFNSTGGFQGPASRLVRVRSLVSQSPRFVA